MFGGLGRGDTDQNAETCWTLLPFGFKFYFLSSIILYILSLLFIGMFFLFANIVPLVLFNYQFWRLGTSFLVPAYGKYGALTLLYNFYCLYMFMPDIEKKYSTAWILLEIVIQTFTCNVVVTVLIIPILLLRFGNFEDLIGYGMLPVVFTFIWKKVAQNPEQPSRFCFIPCLIPLKYIPWCFALFIAILGGGRRGPVASVIIYCLLGWYQSMLRKKSIIRLPLSVYRKIDYFMPNVIKESVGYIKVSKVESDLKQLCLKNGCCNCQNEQENNLDNNRRNSNSLRSNNHNQNTDRVQVIGFGVSLGGSKEQMQKKVDFRNYWKNRQQQDTVQNQKAEDQNIPNIYPAIRLQSDQQFDRIENNSNRDQINSNRSFIHHPSAKEKVEFR